MQSGMAIFGLTPEGHFERGVALPGMLHEPGDQIALVFQVSTNQRNQFFNICTDQQSGCNKVKITELLGPMVPLARKKNVRYQLKMSSSFYELKINLRSLKILKIMMNDLC